MQNMDFEFIRRKREEQHNKSLVHFTLLMSLLIGIGIPVLRVLGVVL
jgi:hypothetical protein